jgi:hypothetical protein
MVATTIACLSINKIVFLPKRCIYYMFLVILRNNDNYFPKQHYPVGHYKEKLYIYCEEGTKLLFLWWIGLFSMYPFWINLEIYTFQTVVSTHWMGDQSVSRSLSTQDNTTKEKNANTSMPPRLGIEPTISLFERAKRFCTLDLKDTVRGGNWILNIV